MGEAKVKCLVLNYDGFEEDTAARYHDTVIWLTTNKETGEQEYVVCAYHPMIEKMLGRDVARNNKIKTTVTNLEYAKIVAKGFRELTLNEKYWNFSALNDAIRATDERTANAVFKVMIDTGVCVYNTENRMCEHEDEKCYFHGFNFTMEPTSAVIEKLNGKVLEVNATDINFI